jgi:hypothetical protein
MSDRPDAPSGTPMNIMQLLDLACVIAVDLSPTVSVTLRKVMGDLAMNVEDDSGLLLDRVIVTGCRDRN